MFFELHIPELQFRVRLGWTPEERKKLQNISIALTFRFQKKPKACQSDDLSDTFCYGKLTEKLVRSCEGRSFKLVESLGHHLFEVAKDFTKNPVDGELKLTLNKLKPPVKEITDGVCFTISDWKN